MNRKSGSAMSGNPWDILPREPKGDADEKDLFMAVGFSMTAWENLEASMAFLFRALVLSKSDAPARAYASVISFSSRADMVLAASEATRQIVSDQHKRVQYLLGLVGKYNARRNEIAHGMVLHFSDNGTDLGYFLGPNMLTNARKVPWGAEQKYRYTAVQVLYYAAEFHKLSDPVLRLASEIEAAAQPYLWPERSQKSRQSP
jgi:hypothetical protein